MIDRDASTSTRESSATLPHPLHLFERLGGSRHFHLGSWSQPTREVDALAQAMDRTSGLCLDWLPPGARVLDVGCGMGGTALLLAEHGCDVVAVDPCERSIAHARAAPTPRPPRFVCGRLDDLPALRLEPFDALLLIESSHYFHSVEDLGLARGLLRPGGTLVSLSVVRCARAARASLPFHEQGGLARVGAALGFVVRRQEELTRTVVPWLRAFRRRLEAERQALIEGLGGARPEIGREIADLRHQLASLEDGFTRGRLAYELTILVRA